MQNRQGTAKNKKTERQFACKVKISSSPAAHGVMKSTQTTHCGIKKKRQTNSKHDTAQDYLGHESPFV
jgi:hypothetical protein